ncbi:hypothetical protein CAPTEDRAFT_192496 [Capitella teleta]|uniref:BACK domain-containing protein n=1 Tax=Capitella teleta TaxID=283909 RepID=R7V0R3_CAPTE|nr:hypothetical protein CAPTEDRAFT_192496 [Capitella teleta]|eukprot:ELU09276.1 hypothetical protein CAPTEDRAFT_192496 [Capitella teleta]
MTKHMARENSILIIIIIIVIDISLSFVFCIRLNLDSHLKAFMDTLTELQEQEVLTDVTLILPDHFFYTGDIKLTAENVRDIVAVSEFLCCRHLKAHCEEYLSNTMDCSNFIDFYKLGKLFNLKVLIKTAFDFILSKFQEGISDYDKLTEDEVVDVVSCDRLNAENEDAVFEAVVHWVNADRDVREEVFPRIASLIRFPFCTQTKLTENVCCNPLMQKPGCIDFAHEALWSQFHFNCRPPIGNERRSTLVSWKPVNAKSTLANINGKIFAFGDDPASKTVKSFNPREANPEWNPEPDMVSPVDKPQIVQFAKKVCALGGCWSKVTQEFDPALGEWRLRSEMPGHCYYGTAVVLDDKIYERLKKCDM